MASSSELACTYAALILQDDDVAITGDKIASILKAANVTVEPFWPSLFAKALEGVDVKSLITNVGAGAGAAPAGGAAPAAAAAAAPAGGDKKADAKKEEKKKEEKKEESDGDMGFGLFD
eukprot:m.52731 g.52731  ORF g.52731 m.52731 type:complete len:119 (+) comp11792_c0_seq1:51-407(+)